MTDAFLTIDDSPSPESGDLLDFLKAENIQALLFCHGDRLEADPATMIRAVREGHILGNHLYSHRRASTLSYDEIVLEIEKTEQLIDAVYKAAGKDKPARYLRFPHLDRGTGGWVVDYDEFEGAQRALILKLFGDGINIDISKRPTAAQFALSAEIQAYLQQAGYTPPPVQIAREIDWLCTYSTADWMLTARHKGKWPYQTLEALKEKIDNDAWLKSGKTQLVLSHDQSETVEITCALIRHMQETGVQFRSFAELTGV